MKTKVIYLKLIIKKMLMFFYSKTFGIEKNKIVFSSFGGKQYSDSGRFLSEELHRKDEKLKIIWLLNDNAMKDKYNVIPKYVIKKKNNVINYIKEISTASVFVSNENYILMYKNKNQMFIDTWHGDRAFKKILHEASENGKMEIPVYDDKIVNYCIAGSKYGFDRFRKAFMYNGPIINEGTPRNDILVNNHEYDIRNIKERIGIKNQKVLLYAPTFRDNNVSMQNITIDFNKILSELSVDGNDWILLIRSHPKSKGINVIVDQNKIIDLTDYPDMTDILLITDFLITDYSSSAMDFVITRKPIILLLYDYDEYKEKCREFSVDPKKVGFIYANNETELLNLIRNTKNGIYAESCEKVIDYYKINETGKSTTIICNKILEFIGKK